MFRRITPVIICSLLTVILLFGISPDRALSAPFVPVPGACPTCDSAADFNPVGDMGSVTPANTLSLGVNIPGAPWAFCTNCNTIAIGGGGLQFPNNTNTLNQSRFLHPGGLNLSLVERLVFTAPITAGSSIHDLFHGMTNLTAIENIDFIDTSATQNFRRAFFNTTSLTGPLDLSMWHTPAATNMYRMFADSGIDILNLGGSFNTGGLVTNYGSMFWGASNLTTIGDVSNWDTSSATRMSRMFQDANRFVSIDASTWDTSNVIFMYSMFHNTSSFISPGDVSRWDVRNVVRMENMFDHTGLTHLDLSGWVTESLQRMDNMFDRNSPNLVYLNVSNFITSGVTNRNNMLRPQGTLTLRTLVLGPGWHWNAFQNVSLPNPPSDATYTGLWIRVGTDTTSTSAQLFDNSLFPNGDIVGTWIWERREVTVTFEAGPDGTLDPASPVNVTIAPAGETLADQQGFTVPTPKPDAGFQFAYWTSPRHAGVTFESADLLDLPIVQDTTFTAVFTPLALIPVTFILNGGTYDSAPDTVYRYVLAGNPIHTATLPVPAPIRPGWTFLGWRADVGAGPADPLLSHDAVGDLIVTAPRTFVAQWQENPIPLPVHERQSYLIGTEDGLIRPNANITRAEAATIFFRLITDEARAAYWMQENPYSDVEPEYWFHNAVSTMTHAGIFVGLPGGTFAPDQTITRAEMTAVIVRFMDEMDGLHLLENHFNDISGHWATGYINTAAADGWAQGPYGPGDAFYPDQPITRAETVAMIHRISGRLQESTEDLLPDMRTWPDNADVNTWYYFYLQSATNSYHFQWRDAFEHWITMIEPRNWAVLERPDSRPEDIAGL